MTIEKLARRALALALLSLTLCAAARAEGTWVPAEPRHVAPQRLSFYTCAGRTTVNARFVFPDTGYRVAQPPVVSRSGQTVTLDVRAEEWTEGRLTMIVTFEKDFDLGPLEPGSYTLVVNSWGSALRTEQFTVRQVAPAASAIDGGCFFVAQHYRDFLSREPDGAGFAFWTGDLDACGADAACRELKRVNVSAAFFLSIEFQNTGYYVYRLYRAALGRAAAYAEFAPEAAWLGRRVVVGSDEPWQLRLNSDKDDFTHAFVGRQEFVARYNGLTNEQYVDKLLETADFPHTRAERDALVADLTNCPYTIGCPTRATVLRKVVEHPALDRRLFNEAFVRMQYFGYLRRDPDPEGFRFWLDKLERFGGDYIAAEMVKAFISSDEYRRRFGQ
ncbi:MAG TPA: DUF4214 domain-containing protein [Pyrinomonadaceae bacterium]|jgi:hypothetical protein